MVSSSLNSNTLNITLLSLELEQQYQNCLLEKDFEYAQLFEECRKLKVAKSARPEKTRSKKKQYAKQGEEKKINRYLL